MNRLLKAAFDKMGYTYEFLSGMGKNLYSDKYLFQDEDKLILALHSAQKQNKHIVVLPDFDMDGISAGCILYAGLSLLGFYVDLYESDVNNGYGFEFQDIDQIVTSYPDVDIILTCDVGIDCHDAIAYAQSKEIWVYVTDHHIEKRRTTADIIVDPCSIDENSEFKGVCGAFMAWHVLHLYAIMTGNAAIISLIDKLRLFVGFGTCGDLMPVLFDSRNAILDSVREFNLLLDCDTLDDYFNCTASMLPDIYVAPFENLKNMHLWLISQDKIKPGNVNDVYYGFTYCPMFNSVKRMGESLHKLYEILYHRDNNIQDRVFLYQWLWDLNQERKKEVSGMICNILEHPENQPFAPFGYFTDARPGVLGLIAVQMMGRSDMPTFILGYDGDTCSGSGRLPDWTPSEVLDFPGVTVAGHERAFGIRIQKEQCAPFFKYVADYIAKYFKEQSELPESEKPVDPRLILGMNGHADLGDYDFSIVRTDDYDQCFDYCMQIDKLRPFGNGFPEPEFIIKFKSSDVKSIFIMGADKTHIKLELDHNLHLVWFGGADQISFVDTDTCSVLPDHVFSFSGKLQINEFRDSMTLQFSVIEQIC